MKYKSLLVIFLILVFSCSSDSEQPDNPQPNPEPPTQGEPDTTAPTITIGGLESEVEVLTTLTISITDASNSVNTIILVNENEVFSTTDKTISYEVDPFDFPSGTTTLTIQSTDNSDNQGEESQTFELKKLLLASEGFKGLVSDANTDIYISVNLPSGELIDSRKIETLDDGKFYVPDGFDRQQFVATSYIFKTEINTERIVFESFSNLQPGAEILTKDEAKQFFNIPNEQRNADFELEISDYDDSTIGAFSSRIEGDSYSQIFSGIGGRLPLKFSYDNTSDTNDIFVYNTPTKLNPDDYSAIEDYRYTILDNPVNQSISYNNFIKAPSSRTVILPEGTIRFSAILRGYENQEAYDSNSYRQLFVDFDNNASEPDSDFSLPLLEEFEVYSQIIGITLNDGREVFSNFRGLSNDLEIPNMDIAKIDNEVTITGDYDFSSFSISDSRIPSSELVIFFQWNYHYDKSNTLIIPYQEFEVSSEISTILAQKDFNIDNLKSSETLRLILEKHEESALYHNRIFYDFRNNERGNRSGIIFPMN